MPQTARFVPENNQLTRDRAALGVNVPEAERLGSIGAGVGLVLYGLSRKSFGGFLLALAGGGLILRGATGYCALYESLGINAGAAKSGRGVRGNRGIKVVRTITVGKPPAEVYRFWRNLENLPRFMEHVESVRELDRRRSAWVVRGPLGQDLEWTAEIITDRENELIAWESLPGAEVENAGSVWFEPVAGGAATEVKVALQYQPPAGAIGAVAAKILGEAPEQQLENDLAKFKSLIEAGVVPMPS